MHWAPSGTKTERWKDTEALWLPRQPSKSQTGASAFLLCLLWLRVGRGDGKPRRGAKLGALCMFT